MTLQASVYIATSLDGFIARPNGDLDWLIGDSGTQSDGDFGYQAFMDTVDVVVMGRNTFEKVLTFGAWPYSGRRVAVLSRSLSELPAGLPANVELILPAPNEVIAHLEAQGAKHLYIDGGLTIQAFLSAGLITDLIITRIPILIGEGIPLFGALSHDIKLEHIETRPFENGFVQSKYRPLYRSAV